MARIVLSPRKRLLAPIIRVDPTWAVVTAEVWAVVEICSGLICASLIPLRPVFKKIFARSRGTAQTMAPAKLDAQTIQDFRNANYRSSAKGEPGPILEKITVTARVRSIDLEKAEANMASNTSVLLSDSRPMLLPLPEQVLTRNDVKHERIP